MPTIRADALQKLVSDIFVKAGTSRTQGDRIAESLVGANLTGHDSHGVVRVPWYVQKQVSGEFVTDQKLKVITETPVLAVVDAQYGFGQSMAPAAVRMGLDKCKAMGLSAILLRNSGHVGRVGEWAEMAAAEGIVSIHYVNAAQSQLVAPFGGVDRRFSTAPYACGIPRPGTDPLILDFATSIVAEGKVLVASQGGKPVPMGALVSADGHLSNDPHVLYGDLVPGRSPDPRRGTGAMRTFGEHKGSAMALACDLLAGALGGSGITRRSEGRVHNGMLSIYLDPKTLDTEGTFAADVRDYIAWIKSAKPIDAAADVIIPGDKERRTAAERTANGVPLPDDVWNSILYAANLVGIDKARISQLTA